MSVRVVVLLLACGLAVGCAKRTAKKPAAEETSGAKAQPQQPGADSPKSGEKEAKDDPNWLNDPRFKTGHGDALPLEAPPNGGKPGWGVGPPPKGGWTAGTPGAPPAPAGTAPAPAPGTGTAAPTPAPAPAPTAPKYSTVTEADMKEVWIFIENRSGATGKMPTALETYQALVAASFTSGALVKDGSIYLTGATTRESIWAFETKALTSGGLVCSQNGVETLTAAELRKRLGR